MGSNHTLGTMITKLNSSDEMSEKTDNMENYLRVIVE